MEKLDLTFKHKYVTQWEEARKHDKNERIIDGHESKGSWFTLRFNLVTMLASIFILIVGKRKTAIQGQSDKRCKVRLHSIGFGRVS